MPNLVARRRWFQFRLSTWFVLVGILGLGLMAQPSIKTEADYPVPERGVLGVLIASTDTQREWFAVWPPLRYGSGGAGGRLLGEPHGVYYVVLVLPTREVSDELIIRTNRWFGLAPGVLLIFLTWKAVLLVADRRKSGRSGPSPGQIGNA
jgi:hypothetical protein